eukprot:gene24089-biopygen22361
MGSRELAECVSPRRPAASPTRRPGVCLRTGAVACRPHHPPPPPGESTDCRIRRGEELQLEKIASWLWFLANMPRCMYGRLAKGCARIAERAATAGAMAAAALRCRRGPRGAAAGPSAGIGAPPPPPPRRDGALTLLPIGAGPVAQREHLCGSTVIQQHLRPRCAAVLAVRPSFRTCRRRCWCACGRLPTRSGEATAGGCVTPARPPVACAALPMAARPVETRCQDQPQFCQRILDFNRFGGNCHGTRLGGGITMTWLTIAHDQNRIPCEVDASQCIRCFPGTSKVEDVESLPGFCWETSPTHTADQGCRCLTIALPKPNMSNTTLSNVIH